MHILITGGEGYIGNYLTEALLEKNTKVTTLDSRFSNKPYIITANYPKENLRRFQASVTNPDAVIRALQGVDLIIHLAARMDYNNTYRHPIRLSQTNVQGTCNLLSMANRAGVEKIIIASDAAVYGNVIPAKESDTPMPLNMYGATKLATEAISRGFYQRGMDIVILRLFNVWGRKNSNGVINKFVNGERIIKGDGKQTRDFIYVDDVIDAFKAAIYWDSGIYNIGTGEETTIESVYSIFHQDKPDYQNFPPGWNEVLRACADMTFTGQSVQWKPKVFLSNLSKDEVIKLCERN